MTLNWPTLPEGYQWDYDTEDENSLVRISIWNADKTTRLYTLTFREEQVTMYDDVQEELQNMITLVFQGLQGMFEQYEREEAARVELARKIAAAKEVIAANTGPKAKPASIAGE